MLEANAIKTSRHVFCTMTASRLLTAGLRDPNDLGSVVKSHLGIDLPKQLGGSDWGGMVLTEQQLEYCRNDVAHLHRLKDALEAKLANPANELAMAPKALTWSRLGLWRCPLYRWLWIPACAASG